MNSSEQHERVIELLAFLANGTLEGAERLEVEKHLENCAACRSELEQVEELRDSMRGDLGERPGPSDFLLPAVLQRVKASEERRSTPKSRRPFEIGDLIQWWRQRRAAMAIALVSLALLGFQAARQLVVRSPLPTIAIRIPSVNDVIAKQLSIVRLKPTARSQSIPTIGREGEWIRLELDINFPGRRSVCRYSLYDNASDRLRGRLEAPCDNRQPLLIEAVDLEGGAYALRVERTIDSDGSRGTLEYHFKLDPK